MLSNTTIKHINALKIKKYRNKFAEFIAEGKKVIVELIQHGMVCKHIYALPKDYLILSKQFPSIPTTEINELQLRKISNLTHPTSCLALFEQRQPKLPPLFDDWILLLDNIQDPGNLGTIIRTADWFKISHIICSTTCADIYNQKTIQASMASIANVTIVETDLIAFMHKHNYMNYYATTLDGIDISHLSYQTKGAIIIGNEGNGISNELLKQATTTITIPKFGNAESLNAAIATAIVLAKIRLR